MVVATMIIMSWDLEIIRLWRLLSYRATYRIISFLRLMPTITQQLLRVMGNYSCGELECLESIRHLRRYLQSAIKLEILVLEVH
jgi:hypothetical protein